MFLPTKVAKKLSAYLTYGLFCAFSLGGVLYAGKDTAKQLVTVHDTEIAAHWATENLMLARNGARSMMEDEAATKSLEELAQEKRLTIQAHKAAEYRFDLLVMAWVPLALCWLVLVSVYAEAESWSGVTISLGVAASVIWFLFRLCHAFGPAIWQWLTTPVVGHAPLVWLLGAVIAGLTGGALYHDFFRPKPVASTN